MCNFWIKTKLSLYISSLVRYPITYHYSHYYSHYPSCHGSFVGELNESAAGFPAARPLDPMLASYLDTWAARVGDAEHGPEAQGPRPKEALGGPRRSRTTWKFPWKPGISLQKQR